jgi:type VI protein secretion system component VasF
MSYLRYLCLFVHRGVQHILCWFFFWFCLSSSCVLYVVSFSGLSILFTKHKQETLVQQDTIGNAMVILLRYCLYKKHLMIV